MPTKQRFTIGVDGSASVEKYGNKIERHINNTAKEFPYDGWFIGKGPLKF